MFFSMNAISNEDSELSQIDSLIWKNRIVLIWSDNPHLYTDILIESESDFRDRDIIWFLFNGSELLSNYAGQISEQFLDNTTKKFSKYEKNVLLIGKDGGVKNSNHTLDLDYLFQRVDSMPMRMNEMKYKEKSNSINN